MSNHDRDWTKNILLHALYVYEKEKKKNGVINLVKENAHE